MRTITVRECSCTDPNSCSQTCGSEMVDRLYVEAAVTDEMVVRARRAYIDACNERPHVDSLGECIRRALVGAFTTKQGEKD